MMRLSAVLLLPWLAAGQSLAGGYDDTRDYLNFFPDNIDWSRQEDDGPIFLVTAEPSPIPTKYPSNPPTPQPTLNPTTLRPTIEIVPPTYYHEGETVPPPASAFTDTEVVVEEVEATEVEFVMDGFRRGTNGTLVGDGGVEACAEYVLADRHHGKYVESEEECASACKSGYKRCMGYWIFSAFDFNNPDSGHELYCAVYKWSYSGWSPGNGFSEAHEDFLNVPDTAETNRCLRNVIGDETLMASAEPVDSSEAEYDTIDGWVIIVVLLAMCCFAYGGYYIYNFTRDEELKRDYTRAAMMTGDEEWHYTTHQTAHTERSRGPSQSSANPASNNSTGII